MATTKYSIEDRSENSETLNTVCTKHTLYNLPSAAHSKVVLTVLIVNTTRF